MKIIITLIFLVGIALNSFSQQQKKFSIIDFGAKGDGKTINTKSIQNTIDAAANAGGGKVIIPAGRFITGVIHLKSNIELYLNEQAALLGSSNRFDYGNENAEALISAKNQHNILITGKGEIDGRGRELVKDIFIKLNKGEIQDDQWKLKRPSEKNRPSLINFVDCDNVTIKNITIKNAAGWVQDYTRCNHLIIDSITVNSTEYWNNDGIDIVNSKNVSITNSFIDVTDDAICLKSEGDILDSCVNVYVANCKLRSSANAFKLGTGSAGGFRNVKVRNLEVYDTYRAAIALESVDGAFLENVDIENVNAVNTGCAILIKLGHRKNPEKFSSIKHIKIANINVKVPAHKPDIGYPIEGPVLKYPHNVFPSSITGIPGHLVEDVVLENITINYEGGAQKSIANFGIDSLAKVPENIDGYPEFSMFGELPCWGMYIRHVEGLTMNNVQLNIDKDDFRTAVVFDDVNKLELNTIDIPATFNLPVIVLKDVKKPSLQKIKLNTKDPKAILEINSTN